MAFSQRELKQIKRAAEGGAKTGVRVGLKGAKITTKGGTRRPKTPEAKAKAEARKAAKKAKTAEKRAKKAAKKAAPKKPRAKKASGQASIPGV